jgi:nuclear-control-of-ATPase protein 2
MRTAKSRASLERMVLDFARDNPPQGSGPLDASQLEIIRKGIQEGDLTPVLRVYEQEMQSPIYNGVMGSLSRALLIQVQKTKVDVEVAMGGIDTLLKSQELVFGFVGLTPGLLVTFGLFRWLSSIPDSRRNVRKGVKQSQAYQILR